MTTRSMITLLAGVAAAAISVSAQAVTITQVLNFGPATTDFSSTQNFNLFDTSLGSLTSISLSDSYGITTAMTVTNSAASASNGNVRLHGLMTFTAGNAGQQAAINAILGDDNVEFFTTPQNYTLNPGDSMTLNATKSASEGAFSSTNGTFLSAFSALGGGTGTINGLTFTETLLANQGGNTSAQQTTTGTGSFTIVYNYDVAQEVPEPAMLGLFGLGAIGLGVARRRKAA